MDKSSQSDRFFFLNDGYSSDGLKFIEEVENYKRGIKNLFEKDFPNVVDGIDSKFNNREDIEDWLEYNFKGFPLVATLTRLTQMQSDIKGVKQDVLFQISSKN